ncbi:MAG: hypothetical protein HUK26_09060, partial [Duodenibacillus sp.]|nr:hypothetical protein [Duodenibacillus sp.]
ADPAARGELVEVMKPSWHDEPGNCNRIYAVFREDNQPKLRDLLFAHCDIKPIA